MVKGIAKHAVIVRSPDLKEFEQAIFIVADNEDVGTVKSADDMLNLACSLASQYSLKPLSRRNKRRILQNFFLFLGGGALASLVWYASTIWFPL